MKHLRFLCLLAATVTTVQCGKKSDDGGEVSSNYIPDNWDGSSDYNLSRWGLESQ